MVTSCITKIWYNEETLLGDLTLQQTRSWGTSSWIPAGNSQQQISSPWQMVGGTSYVACPKNSIREDFQESDSLW